MDGRPVTTRAFVLILITLFSVFGTVFAQETEWNQLITSGDRALEADRFGAAEELYEQAVEVARRFEDQRTGLSYLKLGEARLRQGKLYEAKEAFDWATSLYDRTPGWEASPEAGIAHSRLGSVYLRQENVEPFLAARHLVKAVEILQEETADYPYEFQRAAALQMVVLASKDETREQMTSEMTAMFPELIRSLEEHYGLEHPEVTLLRGAYARVAPASARDGSGGPGIGVVGSAVDDQIGVFNVRRNAEARRLNVGDVVTCGCQAPTSQNCPESDHPIAV